MDAKSLIAKSPTVGGIKRKFDILDALNSHTLSNNNNNNNSDTSPTSGRQEKLLCSPSSTSGKMSNLSNLSNSSSGSASRDAMLTSHHQHQLNLSLGGAGNVGLGDKPSNQSVNLQHLNTNNFYAQQLVSSANSPATTQNNGGGQSAAAAAAANQLIDSIEANKGYTFEEQFKQLYELSDDPKRKEFLDDLFQFMADRNQPVNRIPIMAKQVLDLYELYNLVVERGGLVEVINKKIWREITKGLSLPSSITSAAFTLRTQYMKYLYPYECAKRNFSRQEELQQAIDGNRREGRRSGATGLAANFNYLAGANSGQQLGADQQQGGAGGSCSPGPQGQQAAAAAYSASPSPTGNLFSNHHQQLLSQHLSSAASQQHRAAVAAAAAAAAALQLHRHHQQQQQSGAGNHHTSSATSSARNDLAAALHQHQQHQQHQQRQQRAQSASSSSSGRASPADYQQQQRLYQGEYSLGRANRCARRWRVA